MAITAGIIAGGAALAGGGLSFLGASNQAKAHRAAMERYINYLQGQRDLFLNQEESGAIRNRLKSFIGGNVGYNPGTLQDMKAGVYEDYGRSLADLERISGKAGAGATGVYTPGRASRTTRLLGQNIAANRANSIRDVNMKNADVALNNERLAISALPTYMPGLPATPTFGPDVFASGTPPHIGSYLGPALSQAGQTYANLSIMGPIMEKLLTSQANPYAGIVAANMMNGPGYNRFAPVPYFNPDYARLYEPR